MFPDLYINAAPEACNRKGRPGHGPVRAEILRRARGRGQDAGRRSPGAPGPGPRPQPARAAPGRAGAAPGNPRRGLSAAHGEAGLQPVRPEARPEQTRPPGTAVGQGDQGSVLAATPALNWLGRSRSTPLSGCFADGTPCPVVISRAESVPLLPAHSCPVGRSGCFWIEARHGSGLLPSIAFWPSTR